MKASLLRVALITSIVPLFLTSQVCAQADTSAKKAESTGSRTEVLRQFNGSLEALVSKESPAVAQIQATGLAPVEATSKAGVALMVRQRAIGSES